MDNPGLALVFFGIASAAGAALFLPARGLIPRLRRARRLTERVLIEDALKHVSTYEQEGRKPTLASIAGVLNVTRDRIVELLAEMEQLTLIRFDGDTVRLTPTGTDAALHIIRAHRLWERFLAEKTGYAETEWHLYADQVEHELTDDQVLVLDAALHYPTHDPDGDPIPSAEGHIVRRAGKPLPTCAAGEYVRIVHLEDEPGALYAQLKAEGLNVGMLLRVIEIDPHRIRFWGDGDEHVLAPVVAANISVNTVSDSERIQTERRRSIADLRIGESAEVAGISRACRGTERRRFLDLGITPGTRIVAEMHSPGGDPTAYAIRGAMIALRRQQAEHIKITTESNTRSERHE